MKTKTNAETPNPHRLRIVDEIMKNAKPADTSRSRETELKEKKFMRCAKCKQKAFSGIYYRHNGLDLCNECKTYEEGIAEGKKQNEQEILRLKNQIAKLIIEFDRRINHATNNALRLQKIADEKELCGVHKCGIEELAEKQGYAKALEEELKWINKLKKVRHIASSYAWEEVVKREKELKSSLQELGKC